MVVVRTQRLGALDRQEPANGIARRQVEDELASLGNGVGGAQRASKPDGEGVATDPLKLTMPLEEEGLPDAGNEGLLAQAIDLQIEGRRAGVCIQAEVAIQGDVDELLDVFAGALADLPREENSERFDVEIESIRQHAVKTPRFGLWQTVERGEQMSPMRGHVRLERGPRRLGPL